MTSVRNIQFFAHTPLANLESVESQMLAAHRYRNKLCEMELARRAASESVIRHLSPEYAALAAVADVADARVDAIYTAIKEASRKAQTRIPPTADQEQEIADAKTARAEAYEAASTAKKAAYAMLAELQAPLREQAASAVPDDGSMTPTKRKRTIHDEYIRLTEIAGIDAGQGVYERSVKNARENCGCYWGTYLTAEDAASEFHIGPPPRFLRWAGDGTVAVQLQGGLTFGDACEGNDTRLQIGLKNAEELATKGRSRGVRCIGMVRMRIGSDGRNPIWSEIPVRFTRYVPDASVIKWAFLHRCVRGTNIEWSFRMTVELPDIDAPGPVTGVCAVHPGYRLMSNGSIRVACLAATRFPPELLADRELSRYLVREGDIVEVRLPHDFLSRKDKADGLSKIRDQRLNRHAPRLVRWLTDHDLPDWIKTATETIGLWKSQARFHDLFLKWNENRFTGDDLAFALFSRWHHRDIHLHQYEFNLPRKANDWRKQLYRTLARLLSQHYARIIVPKIDWKKWRERPDPDEKIVQVNRQRRIASTASPGMLIEYIQEACAGRVSVVPAKHITASCAGCGQIDEWDQSKRWHACTKCGDQWDQDHNAARNELARGMIPAETPGPLASHMQEGVTTVNETDGDIAATEKKATSRKSRRNRRAEQMIQ